MLILGIGKLKKNTSKLDSIDKNAVINGLTTHDRTEQKELSEQLRRILKQEELKWLQRYKDKEIR